MVPFIHLSNLLFRSNKRILMSIYIIITHRIYFIFYFLSTFSLSVCVRTQQLRVNRPRCRDKDNLPGEILPRLIDSAR